MDVFGRMLENAVGLTKLVSWSHRRAEAEGAEVSMKKELKMLVFSSSWVQFSSQLSKLPAFVLGKVIFKSKRTHQSSSMGPHSSFRQCYQKANQPRLPIS